MAKSRTATRSVPVRRASSRGSSATKTATPPAAAPSPQLFYDIAGIGCLALATGLLVALVDAKLAGPLGQWFVVLLRLFVGHGVYLSPLLFGWLGYAVITRDRPNRTGLCHVGVVGALGVVLGWLHLLSWGEGSRFASSAARIACLLGSRKHMEFVQRVDGGFVGGLVTLLLSPVGLAGSYIVLVAAGISSALLLTETSFGAMAGRMRDRSRRIAEIMVEREAARQEAHEAAMAARQSMPMHQPRPATVRRKGPFIDLEGEEKPLLGEEAADTAALSEKREPAERRSGFRLPGLGFFLRAEPRPEAPTSPTGEHAANLISQPLSLEGMEEANASIPVAPPVETTALVPVEPQPAAVGPMSAHAEEPASSPLLPGEGPGVRSVGRRDPVRTTRQAAQRRTPNTEAPGGHPTPNTEWQDFVLPPLELLETPPAGPRRTNVEAQENIAILENTLRQFRIEAQVVEIADGPTVTRYEIRLGEGIRVKKIVDLADNIAMSLAALTVRVEAPIPGKSAIGIEVPKKHTSMVTLREVLECPEFQNHPSKIAFALGKDVAGTPQHADLARMPHLLVAGATNAGKSVCLNTLIASMLYRARPDELKFLFIDPKRVELTLFDGIPHLCHPVVKDVKQAAGILRWALKEMDHRYDLFTQVMTRNIAGYNEKVADKPEKRLPYLVIVIDELADLMMQQGPEVEQAICRLAQLARATGIHLVVATQRPSVDVITGLIKANVPSRIAFAVTSQIDSRTILDQKGAENLIGRGDMLFKPVDANKPLRVQGAFVSEAEVVRLVEHLKSQGRPEYIAQPLSVDSGAVKGMEEDADDDLFEPATRFIVTTGHASTSSLQRKFKIGYTRAARLVDMMESRGVVGSLDGAKPREILMSRDQVDALFAGLRDSLSPGATGDDLETYFDDMPESDAAAHVDPANQTTRRGGEAGWSLSDEADEEESPTTPADDDPFVE
jgi:S-DNA-T family DNA segregation ATPase FtsK/SpoIIIE